MNQPESKQNKERTTTASTEWISLKIDEPAKKLYFVSLLIQYN